MNSEKKETPQSEVTNVCSDKEANAPAESAKALDEQVENQSTAQDSLSSPTNPLQPESSKVQSGEEEQSSVEHPTGTGQTEQPSLHKSTGPRTAQGKQRSRLNALKHGLFFKGVLLPGESRSEYLSLLDGLLDYHRPVGTMESVVVENLAAILWRQRRLFPAENAEISENRKLVVHNSLMESYAETCAISRSAPSGLFGPISNPLIVGEAKETLILFRRMFTTEGLRADFQFVQKLSGENHKGVFMQDYISVLRACAAAAELAEKKSDTSVVTEPNPSFVAFIDAKIESLARLEKSLLTDHMQEAKYKLCSAAIPGQEALNRLLPCYMHFSREIDRLLNRLERLQRIRKGQPLPPRLDVKIS